MKSLLLFASIFISANLFGQDGPFYFTHNNTSREFYLHIPNNLPANAPIIYVFHGWGGNGLGMMNQTAFNYLSDENNFAVTDLSHSKAIIEIEGNQAKEVLKKGCPFNFNELNKDNCLNSVYHGMSITVDMLDDQPDKFRIFTLRSFGESLYHSITDASLEFGYLAK